MKTIGERIKIVLAEKSLKATSLADKIGVSNSTMSFYTHNRTYPSERFFITIKEVVPSLNLNWLITGEGEKYLGSSTPSGGSDKEILMQHEIDELKTAQAYLLKSMSALSTTILDKQTPQDGRSFNPGVRETGRIIANFIEKYTAAHTPYVADGATA